MMAKRFRIADHGVSRVEIAGDYFAGLTRSYAIWCGPQQGEITTTSIHHNVFEGEGPICYGVLCQPQGTRDMSDINVINNTFLNLQQAVLVQPLGGRQARGIHIANNLCVEEDEAATHLTPQFDLRATAGVITDSSVRNSYFHGFESHKGLAQTGASNLDLMPATQIYPAHQYFRIRLSP